MTTNGTSDHNHGDRNIEIDETSGTYTTGHEWDGIKELDTPMPRWWLWTFYATIVFSIGYVIYYPAIPLIETSTKGISGITARGQFEKEMARVGKERAGLLERIKEDPIEGNCSGSGSAPFAVAGGQSMFKVYCSQCHGSGAAGGPGYPNLNDDDWLWGGDLNSIYTTIAHGVRGNDDDNARFSQMPAFGKDGILDRPSIRAISEFVLSLSGHDHDPKLATEGKPLYAENCASCHGENGKGGRDFGAPNLADQISLYGTTRELVIRQVNNPRHGVMPPWLDRLGEARVKQLAIYVHSLGGGEKDLAAAPEEKRQAQATGNAN